MAICSEKSRTAGWYGIGLATSALVHDGGDGHDRPGGVARALGFVTQESLGKLGLEGHVTVYLPQSYNFAGMLLIFPTSAVTAVKADSADVMAFIVSGGVTEL